MSASAIWRLKIINGGNGVIVVNEGLSRKWLWPVIGNEMAINGNISNETVAAAVSAINNGRNRSGGGENSMKIINGESESGMKIMKYGDRSRINGFGVTGNGVMSAKAACAKAAADNAKSGM
jgi:hypothetical protein